MKQYGVQYTATKYVVKNGDFGQYTEKHAITRSAKVFAESEDKIIEKIESFHEGYKVIEMQILGDLAYNHIIM